MDNRVITIKDNESGTTLASAAENAGVKLFEGAWYFDREMVDMTYLVVTDRTYICPYKGVCYWIDLAAPGQQAKDVAFTYFDVNPDYEFIRDKVGFYAGKREATEQTAVGCNP